MRPTSAGVSESIFWGLGEMVSVALKSGPAGFLEGGWLVVSAPFSSVGLPGPVRVVGTVVMEGAQRNSPP